MRSRGLTFSHPHPARLHRIYRAQCSGAASTPRPGTELLGTSEHRAILPSNYRQSMFNPLEIPFSPQTFYLPQVDERVFISGQIGLIPSSLSLPSPQTLAVEAALSSQHVHRVVDALKNSSGGGWSGHTQGIIYWLARKVDVPAVRAASAAYAEVSLLFSPVRRGANLSGTNSPSGRSRSYRVPCCPRAAQRRTDREAGCCPHGSVQYPRGRRNSCALSYRAFLERRWVLLLYQNLHGAS